MDKNLWSQFNVVKKALLVNLNMPKDFGDGDFVDGVEENKDEAIEAQGLLEMFTPIIESTDEDEIVLILPVVKVTLKSENIIFGQKKTKGYTCEE